MAKSPKKAKKVLIVEDEGAILRVLSEKLQSAGIEVHQALDGVSGLEQAKSLHPDMILLDLVLPMIDGLTLLRRLREDEWGKSAEVIILSNLSDNKRVAEAMTLGVYDYLVKSTWDIDEVTQKIKSKLGL